MTKEEILKYVESVGGDLIGFFQIPFPIYVVHVAYDSVDSDPFFPLYKAILHYVLTTPKMDKTAYFAQLIGFEKELIDQCIRHLKGNGMIRMSQDIYIVTDDAKRKYLTANNRPTVRITGSFPVDGKNLALLPDFVYQEEKKISNFVDSNVSAHVAIDMSMNASIGAKVIKHLDNFKTLEKLHLETTGSNFELLGFDKKYLMGADAIFYTDKEGHYHKEIIYNSHPLNCRATGSAETYTIELKSKNKEAGIWTFYPNMGYNVADNEAMRNVAVFTQNEGWADILSKAYATTDFEFHIENDEKTKLPVIHLQSALLEASSIPLQVIEDARKGYKDFSFKPNGMVRIKIHHELQNYIDFIEIIKNWMESECKKYTGEEIVVRLNTLFPNWRKLMVRFKLYEELEKIDCARFIKY